MPGESRSSALQVDSLPAEPQGKLKNTGVGSLSLLQGIFLTQESNRGLLHCRRLQCSCLENPRDRGAWWAAVYGVAQSRTRLKRLSSRSMGKIEGVAEDEMVGWHHLLNDMNLYNLWETVKDRSLMGCSPWVLTEAASLDAEPRLEHARANFK